MSKKETELRTLLDFAVLLAQETGKITQQYFRNSVIAERKADGSPVTAADREAETHLRTRIAEAFPHDGIVGEEEEERPGSSGYRWIIDPIDGTFSFVRGVPLYGVLIGLEADGEMLLGVANLPAVSEIVYAARGLGCFCNGNSARVSSTSTLDQALLLSTDFGVCEEYGFGAACERLQAKVASRRTWGDCYGHVLVATGRAEIMLDPVMNIWDCAALLPILEEAGGTFTNWSGQRTIDGNNAISTNGILFDDVMRIVLAS